MSTDIPIPVAVAPRLREGAKAVMRSLGCELEDAAVDPAAFGKLHHQLRGMWGLLDVIGWSDEDDGSEVEVDLHEHSAAVVAALDLILPLLADWLAEMADDDKKKPSREDEYRLVRQFEVVARREIASMEQGQ